MENNYYDTTHETDGNLKKYKKQARKQDQEILDIFREHPDMNFTCNDIEDILASQGKVYPRTSVGRSMNTLTKSGKLLKTDQKKVGRYGRMVYTWILKTEGGGQVALF